MNAVESKIEKGPIGPDENEKIVFIEYDKNDRPSSIVTHKPFDHRNEVWFKLGDGYDGIGVTCETYDIYWSEARGEIYWHNSGSGPADNKNYVSQLCEPVPPAKIWGAAGMIFVGSEDNELTTEQIRASGYEVIAEPLNMMPFKDAYESDCEYCSVCGDWYPDDHLCRHIFWEDGYSGIGSDEGAIGADEVRKQREQALNNNLTKGE